MFEANGEMLLEVMKGRWVELSTLRKFKGLIT
jgi:hypothetical protein